MLTLVERILLLADVPVFGDIGTADLASLATVAREWDARPGETIHAAGDAGDALHVVISGAVRLERAGASTRVGPGRGFGVFGLFDDRPRRLTATAETAARLLSIEREAFADVLADHAEIARGVLRVLAGRLRDGALSGSANLGDEMEIG